MRFISRFLISLVLLVTATAAWAQETGSISGNVSDSNGLGVPGATVKVFGPQLPAGRAAVTTVNGAYNFQRLIPGRYTVEAELQGLGKAAVSATVSVDRDTQIALKLIQRTTSEVVVTAPAVEVDKKSAEVSTSYNSSEIKELPLARTYTGLLQLVPGAADPTVAGTIVGVSIAGGTRQDSKYLVDGVDITNPGYGTLNIQTNDIDIVDFDVKRGGITAEFGRTSGAIINAVTRSGTNDFHGVARFEALPATFIANQTGTTTTQKIDSYTGAAGLGFPIVKDTLFGYVSGRYYSTTSSGQSSPYGTQPDSTTKNQDYFGKLTGNFGSSLLLNASFRALPVKADNQFNSLLDADTSGYTTDTTNYVGNATASWFVSNNSYLEAKYIHLTENDTSDAQTVVASQPTTIDPAHLGNFGRYADPARGNGNSGIAEFASTGDSYKRDEIRLSASQFLDLGPTQHQIKVGAGYENDDYTLVRQTNGWGLMETGISCPKGVCNANASVPGTIRARFYTLQPTQTGKARTYSLFLQDNVTWNRLSVNVGVLLNKDDFAQIALNGTRYNFMTFGWSQEIQPRLGIAYNSDFMKGDKFYGSYGRYASLDQKSTSRSFAPFRIRQDQSYFDPVTGAFLGTQVRGSSSGKVIPIDLRPPYYDEVMAGYEAPIANVLSANVYYQYRSLHQAFEDNPIDPNNYVGAFQAANIPGASKIYRGYTLELNKRLADRWAASLSYTYSELTGNFDEDYSIEAFNTSSLLEDAPGLNSTEPNRYGHLANDRPHIFKAFASYDTPFGVTVGGYYRYQSGTPWQATGVDANGTAHRYLEPAGSRRLPGWSNFDLLAAYNFRFGGSYNLRLEGRMLNVFNTQTPLTVNTEEYLDSYVDGNPPKTLGPQGTSKPNPAFGQYTSYTQPRRFVATLIFEF